MTMSMAASASVGSTRKSGPRPRLAIGIIGVGRVGSVLGAALAGVGHAVVAASVGSDASRERAARMLPGVPLVAPTEVLRRSDVVLLAVPDDALAGLVEGLAASGAIRAGSLVVHTSGRFGLGALAASTRWGASPLALHPVMTFTGSAADLPRLSGASFGVTAPVELRPVAEALVIELGAEPVWVTEDARELYHAALAHGANHLVTLVNSTSDLLRAAGVEAPARMLAPLLGAAMDNALRAGDAALTGPVARGDAGTVVAHLTALTRAAPHLLPLYLTLARATADRALAGHILGPSQAETLLDVLANPDGACA
jgi:predicted short-subunit dehydrogenase-like oxidoreductase (DUF2520 family)